MASLDATAVATPQATVTLGPAQPRNSQVERESFLDLTALAVLLLAAAFPASPPTVGQVLSDSGAGFWGLRIGPANAFEMMAIVIAVAMLTRSLIARPSVSRFDRPLLGAALIILGLQAFALPQHLNEARFVPLDLERLLIPIAAYVIVTRSVRSFETLRTFAIVIAGVICARAIELVLVYGITGQTQFGTITGGEALLITEDTLLILLPLSLAWGALVDGRLTVSGMVAAMALVSSLLLIDLLSLRRGAMLLIGGALLARSLGIGRRRLLQGGAALLVAFALAVAAGPGRPLLHQLRYTAVSSLLRTKDASSSQRTAEISSFASNMKGADWITGRGLGVTWYAFAKAPIDSLSYGPGESEFTRIGWHVYGLDWIYKFGLLGLAAILAALVLIAREALRTYRRATAEARWLIYSLAVCIPPFALLLFTNPRVALMTGVTLGLLSRCCDLAAQTSTTPSGRKADAPSSVTAAST
jgi:hypothetical protein